MTTDEVNKLVKAFDAQRRKRDAKYYEDLISTYPGIQIQSIAVRPWARHGVFTVSGVTTGQTEDKYFDIGNVALGNISVTPGPVSRTFYRGALHLVNYVNVNAGTVTVVNYLSSGANNDLSNYLYKKRSGLTASDSNVNSPNLAGGAELNNMVDHFDDIMFNYLHCQCIVTGVTPDIAAVCNWQFTGVRIDY